MIRNKQTQSVKMKEITHLVTSTERRMKEKEISHLSDMSERCLNISKRYLKTTFTGFIVAVFSCVGLGTVELLYVNNNISNRLFTFFLLPIMCGSIFYAISSYVSSRTWFVNSEKYLAKAERLRTFR